LLFGFYSTYNLTQGEITMSYQTLTNFGFKLKDARLNKGMELERLAHGVGITVDELTRIERVTRDVTITQAQQLARAVDLAVSDLL
jgi:transcriptional regulator with XRE-family HTH domain